MSKPPRPGLDALPFAVKTPQLQPATEVEQTPPKAETKAKDDRVTLIIRVPAADRRELKMIAADRETTIQDMMADAIQDIIRRSK